jgi:hypothetical protein
MCEPLVTVVTPSYNQGRFIRATIESVLSQDYPNIEYIIMDGGSSDETAAVAAGYAGRLTFISERDRGQSHAINKGFRMARGSIVAWLNSDDIFLPGAVRAAVAALLADPSAGAVYGEGWVMDELGNRTSRFRCTEPFNLWKLVHLSDYVLQQTVYFRKDVLEEVGYLDESLNYTMDWDILIRIGMRRPLRHVPVEMGCLREYPTAKSFAGGPRRVREIRDLLRRHTGCRFPPGYVTYGLQTYQQRCCDGIAAVLGPLTPVRKVLQSAVRLVAGTIIAGTELHAQGLYPDRWAARVLRYMLPPAGGVLALEGFLPDWPTLRGQTLRLEVNGQVVAILAVSPGDFRLTVDLPAGLRDRLLNVKVTASRSRADRRYGAFTGRRRVAYRLDAIRWFS